MAAKRRRFGNVRKLPSGRYQASYLDPEGVRRAAPETFSSQRAASQWLSMKEAELLRGEWRNPDDQRETIAEFGDRWIKERSGLRPRTVDLYRWLFGKYIDPKLGRVTLGEIDSARVRTWRAGLLAEGVSDTMAAKAYRLLRAILMTAVDDGTLPRNPCRIRGAGAEPTPERPTLTVDQVFELAAAVPERYAALVLVTTFGSLRWGEVTALRRCDVDTDTGVIRVRAALAERSTGELLRGQPKSRAGVRSVTLPRPIRPLLARHMARFAVDDPEALIFTGDKGAALRRSNFNRQAKWPESVAKIGAEGLHFHDLRHTGNHFAAQTGASLRDLMARMGHDSMRAALIYQHANQTGDQEIADGIEELLSDRVPDDAEDQAEGDDDDPDDGAAGALVRMG
jgi:integrase